MTVCLQKGLCLVGFSVFIWFPSEVRLYYFSQMIFFSESLLNQETLLPKQRQPIHSKEVCVFDQLLSRVWLFVDPMDCNRQTSLTIGFFRQEYWSELPFPPPRDLPGPGVEHVSPTSTLAGGFFTTEPLFQRCPPPPAQIQFEQRYQFLKH